MTFRVVIPARYGSVRLPGKVLLPLAGKPMLQWVYERAVASAASEVWVATDDARIEQVAAGFGAQVMLTSQDHPSGTDRIAELVRRQGWPPDDIVVNVQGDEPLIPPAIIDQVAGVLAAVPAAQLATLAAPLRSAADLFDINVVKVVTARDGRALYFSRAAIPCDRDATLGMNGVRSQQPAQSNTEGFSSVPLLSSARRHIGIYAYRTVALAQLAAAASTPLESLEKLEQLRALELGMFIQVADAWQLPLADVNTSADAVVAERLLSSL